MSTNIRFKRSDVPGKVPSLDALDLGELAINSADGKLFTKQEFKPPGGLAAIQKIVEIGATAVPNVLYVSKGGDDSNSGKTLGESFASLKKALSIATPGTTIFLKSGEYIEDNPLRVPARVSVVGDNLRNTTVRPKNPTKDIFWVYNGAYIFCMNFKGHIAPSAAVCFPPDGSAGEIVTSPYTQAVTSITTTGTGMRVDGAVTTGLRSMVCDAFTQYNQGGVGIHMLNRGNTQLVSIFTICCDISFLCESGGFCSVNLSNSSFGNYGLVSRGASEILYRGVVKKSSGRQITFKNLAKRPNIGDGVLFANYNQATCNRDNGLVVDSLAFDLLHEGTTQSTFAGLRYWAKDIIEIEDQGEETVAAIDFAQKVIKKIINKDAYTPLSSESPVSPSVALVPSAQRLINDEFSIISKIVKNGPISPKVIITADYDLAEPEYKFLREQVLDRKAEIQDQTIAFINRTFPSLKYVQSKCSRDVGLIIDAVINDAVFNTNYLTVKAARTYLSITNGLVIPAETKTATIEAIKFVRDKVIALLTEDATFAGYATANFKIITDALTDASGAGVSSSLNAEVLRYTTYQDTNTDVNNLVVNLQANKDFIKASVIQYINDNYPSLRTSYSETVCARDIGYTLDGICYDLAYGGNAETLDAAKRYYSYANGTRQLAEFEFPATVDAYGRVQLLSQRVVILDVIQSSGLSEDQVFALDGADLVATNQTQVNRLGGLFQLFLKQIEKEIVATSDFIQSNGAKLDDEDLDDAYDTLQANKAFIKAEVIAYLTNTYPAFAYDRVKCARDIGYIIDSICFDITHGGNRQIVQAGIYYYGFNDKSNVLTSVLPKQNKQTINAYLYLKELLADVITSKPTPNPWQGAIPQRLATADMPAATAAECSAINNLIDVIVEILREGPNNAEDSVQRARQAISLTPTTDINKIRAFDLLMANKEFIQAELKAYININWYEISDGDTQFARVSKATELTLGTTTTGYPVTTYQPASLKAIRDAVLAAKEDIKTETIKFMANSFFDNFSFNKPKCYRDVGLILDAILSDMIFDSNYKTITAAASYFRAYASDVIGPQKVQTIAALEATKVLTLERVVTPAAKTAIATRFDILLDIIKNGTVDDPFATAPAITYPLPLRNSEEDIERKQAVTILRNNINFIKEEIADYVDANFTLMDYDREKCARDVGLIIDALGWDLMFGSNFRAITAGRSYQRVDAAKVVKNQKLATIGAFKQLKKVLAESVKLNTLAVNSIQRGMDIIIDIVQSNGADVPKYIIPFPTSGRDVGYKRARDLVEKNREFIVSEVLAFISAGGNSDYPFDAPLGYDEVKCERDLNLILDAVYYDITYGGTLESEVAARSYFVGALSQLDPSGSNADEVTATLNAYEYLKDVLALIAVDSAVTRTAGNTTVQLRSPTGSDGSSQAAADMVALVNLIRLYINEGNATDGALTIAGTVSQPNTKWVDPALVAQYRVLQDEKVAVKDAIVDYVNTNYVVFGYDRDTCARDVGLIIDAVRYDMMFGGNFQSITAGRSYWRAQASVVRDDQKVATLAAFELLKTKLLLVVGSNVTAKATVTSCMDAILAIIDRGLTAAPVIVWPVPTDETVGTPNAYTQAYLDARDDIQTAKESLVSTVNQWVLDAYNNDDYAGDGFIYGPAQQANCQRDLRFIIDAICYDLTYGGTMQSDIAARAYRSGVTGDSVLVSGDLQVTIDAYGILADELADAVIGVGPKARVAALADRIAAVIGGDTSATTLAPTDWVAASLTTLSDAMSDASTSIQTAVTAFVDANYAYNRDKCKRDVGYLIDAMSYDLLYGGNLDTVSAAQSYFDGAITPRSIIPKEIIQSVAAYERLKEVIQDVVQLRDVVPSSNKFVAGERVAAGMDLVNRILNSGESVAPTRPWALPLPTGGADNASVKYDGTSISGYLNARNLIEANRDFVKAEAIAYITTNYSAVVYNQETCKRDIDYILDAIYYDMTYGGNSQTRIAAQAYYSGASQLGAGQKAATVALFAHLADILESLSKGSAITVSTGNTVVQKRGDTAPSQQRDVSPFNGATHAKTLMTTVRNYVNNDTLAAEDLPDTSWVDSGLITISTLLDAEASSGTSPNYNSTIQTAVTAFIDTNYPDLTYDDAKCRRDIGIIVDALRFDMMFGTNFATTVAGRSYSREVASEVNGDQKQATLAAFNFAKAKLLELIADNSNLQNKEGITGSSTAASAARTLVGIVYNSIFNQAAPSAATAPSADDLAWVEQELVDISDAMDNDRANIKTAVTDYITKNYSDLDYEVSTCQRDVELVIDAVRYDMMFGSNFKTIVAARSYYRSQVVNGDFTSLGQKPATITAFELLREKLLVLASGNETAKARVTANMALFLKILAKGEEAIPAFDLPSPTGYNTAAFKLNYANSRNLINANREFFKAELVKKIVTFGTDDDVQFNVNVCLRDVDFIIDAVCYDLTYGGNTETTNAAASYYASNADGITNSVPSAQRLATADAYSYLRDLVEGVALNQDLSPIQMKVPQVFGPKASLVGSQAGRNLAWNVRDHISTTTADPAKVYPDLSWVDGIAPSEATRGSLENFAVLLGKYKTNNLVATTADQVIRIGLPDQLTSYSIARLGGLDVTDFDTVNNEITTDSNHGLEVGDIVVFKGTLTGTGLTADVQYYVLTKTSDTFTLSATRTGTTPVDILGSGSGVTINNYNITKCKRDVSLILDAVRYDMAFNTKFKTIVAARSYLRSQASAITGSQKAASLELFTEMKAKLRTLATQATSTLGIIGVRDGGGGGETGTTGPIYTRISELMDLVINTIDDEDESNLPVKPYSLPLPTGLNTVLGTPINSFNRGFLNARTAIETNREFIKAEMIAWIDDQARRNVNGFNSNLDGTPFTYSRVTCLRDLDYILDGIYYDLTYGGNTETINSGTSYYSGLGIQSLDEADAYASEQAYDYLGRIILDVTRNVLVDSVQTAVPQVRGAAAGAKAAQTLEILSDTVINIVKGGVKQVPERIEPDFLAGDETLAYVRSTLQEQKKNLQARIADYIDSYILQYNTEKCARDVGLIIDCVMYDLVLNSNFQSITAGSVYLQKAAGVVTSYQIGPQLEAIKFIRDKCVAVSKAPPLTENLAAIAEINNRFDILYDIVDKGVEVAPPVVNVPPQGAAFNPNAINAAKSIIANKEFLKEEATAYITANYKTYDQSRCARDVGLIIDAALFDLLLGTNYNSIKAGLSYRRATSSLVVSDQLTETLGGIDFALRRVTALTTDATAIASITASFELIKNIISGGSIPVTQLPLAGGSVYSLPRASGKVFRSSSYFDAVAEIKSNVASIATAVSDYIIAQIDGGSNPAFKDFEYGAGTPDGVARQTACEQDIGYILEALCYDLTYGGNMETVNAGRAYYAGLGALESLEGEGTEVAATYEAYTFLAKYLSEEVLQDAGIPENVAVEAERLILGIRNLVDAGENSNPTVVTPDLTWVSTDRSEYVTLDGNILTDKEVLKTEIINFVNSNKSNFANNTHFDAAKCERDLGYILDAVFYDAMTGSNYQTVTAGLSYRRLDAGDVLTIDQRFATIRALQKAKLLVLAVSSVNSTVKDRLKANLTTVIDLISDSGYDTSAPTLVFTNNIVTTTDAQKATAIDLQTNRASIKTALVAWFTGSTGSAGVDYYDGGAFWTGLTQAKREACTRDVGYIIDALTYDLLYGGAGNLGNWATKINARAYFVGNVSQLGTDSDEKTATLAAYAKLKTLIAASVDDTLTSRSETLIDLIITEITDAGNDGIPDEDTFNATIVKPPLTGNTNSSSLTNLNNAKADIISDTLDYIVTREFDQFDEAKCARDVGYMIDALRYDLLFGTSFRSYIAGRSYTREAASRVYAGGDEFIATYAAITHLKSLMLGIVVENAAVLISADAQARLKANFEIIRQFLEGNDDPTYSTLALWSSGTTYAANAVVFYKGTAYRSLVGSNTNHNPITATTYWVQQSVPTGGTDNIFTTSIATARNNIAKNRDFIIDEVLAYIDQESGANSGDGRGNFRSDEYPFFALSGPQRDTCERDLGYMIDAFLFDLTYGGNLETFVAGSAYYNGTVLGAGEKLGTLDAYKYLSAIIAKVAAGNATIPEAITGTYVQGTTGGNTARIISLVDLVIDFIDACPIDPRVVTPSTDWVASKLFVFSNALNDAKTTVAKTTTDYVLANFPELGDGFVTKCRRDIGLIIDAVRWDMMFNTNFRSAVAARSYYRAQAATVLGVQKAATKAAFGIVKTALQDIVKSDDTAYARVGASMDLVIDIIEDDANVPTLQTGLDYYGGTVSSFDSGYLSARDRIEANRDFIKAEIAAYIERTSASPAAPADYDKATCLRDVDYILDAVRYDLTYGGNLATVEAGRAYYNGTSFSADYRADEIAATVAAYERLRVILGQIAQNATVTKTTTGPSANTLTQSTSGLAGSVAGAATAQALIVDLKTYIDSTPGASNNAAERLPNTSWVNSQFVSFATTMGDNKESLGLQVTDYVDANFPTPFTYDKETCARDVGYIVDAVRYDMMFDNNFRSYVAGRSYYRAQASLVVGDQKEATLSAFKFLKDRLLAIVAGNAEATKRVTSAMRTVLDTINLGETTRNSYDPLISTAVGLLGTNKASLLSQMGTYLDTADNSFTFTYYNKTTCLRDIGYVIDAIKYDLTYGGNMETVVAGRAYYEGVVLRNAGQTTGPTHIAATKAAFTELGVKIAAISTFPGSVADRAKALLANVNALIDDDASVTEVYADASWSDTSVKEIAAAMLDNKVALGTAVTDYVTANFPELAGVYNVEKCARDAGLLVDAVRWDMLFASNFRSIVAGRAYYRDALNLNADGLASLDQKKASIAAFSYLKEQLLALATGNKVASTSIAANMDVILEILSTGLGDNSATVALSIPDGTRTNTEYNDAKTYLLANKASIVNEVVSYINTDLGPFIENGGDTGYNETKCARDVGYIVTAVAYDLVTGSNYQSTIAALRYLGNSAVKVLGAKEKHMTILSLRHLKHLLASIVASHAASVTAVKASMDLIINIINVGDDAVADALTGMTFPTSNVTSTAQTALRADRQDIIDDIETFLTGYTVGGFSWTALAGRQATCLRDVGYIIDAITYDLTYGGNWATTIAARAYYVAVLGGSDVSNLDPDNNSPLEKAATLAAYAELKTLLTGYTGSGDLVDIITDVVDNGLSALPTVQYPELLNANADKSIAKNNLLNSVDVVKTKTIRYINERTYFQYDSVKCERDLGYILDAVFYDIVTGSNYQSVTAGLAYTRLDAEDAISPPQKFAILAALTRAKSLVANVVSTNAAAVTAIRDKLSIVIDIINDEGNAPALSFPTGNVTTTATNTLQTNRATIISDLDTAMAGYTVGTFAWDTFAGTGARYDTCLRDVGLIVDALTHDLTYGGNWATVIAARSYFAGVSAQLGTDADEVTATVEAYDRLKTVIAARVSGQTTDANNLINVIRTYIGGGSLPAITYPTLAGADTKPNASIFASKAALVAAKENLVIAIQDSINDVPYIRNGAYDAVKCGRDVNLIIEAIGWDLMFGTTYRTVKAGQSYLRSYAKTVTSEQKAATIGALYFVKKQLTSIVSNAGNRTTLRGLMDIVIDILDRGVVAIPASDDITMPAPTAGAGTAFNSTYADGITTIVNNTSFIKAEVRAWIARNYPELDYDKNVCERDVVYILEALRYDMTYGGNTQTVEAGRSYLEGTALTLGVKPIDPNNPSNLNYLNDPDSKLPGGETEKVATVGAYNFLGGLLRDLISDEVISPQQTIVEVGTRVGDSSAVGLRAKGLIDGIKNIVDQEDVDFVAVVVPSYTWASVASKASYALLVAATTLDDDVVSAITDAYEDQWFVYNEDKCARDLGFIVDALAYDLAYGGNRETRDCGVQYLYKGGIVIPTGTKGPTLLAIGNLISNIYDRLDGEDYDTSIATESSDILSDNVYAVLKTGVAPALVIPDLTKADTEYVLLRDLVLDNVPTIQADTITFINTEYAGFGYKQETCKRDIGLTLDAVAYDLIYGGNSRTKYAAEQYFSGGRLQIPADSKTATAACFNYLDFLVRLVIKNEYITPFQSYASQDTSNVAATQGEVTNVAALFDAFTDIVTNGYISVVTLDATFKSSVDDNTYATFHQVSQITTTGHTLEWVGTGIDVDSALPYNGGVPIEANEIVSENGGFINFTSTDQKGDFKIGPELTIKRDSGSIVGRAFNKSLLGVITPYILALNE